MKGKTMRSKVTQGMYKLASSRRRYWRHLMQVQEATPYMTPVEKDRAYIALDIYLNHTPPPIPTTESLEAARIIYPGEENHGS